MVDLEEVEEEDSGATGKADAVMGSGASILMKSPELMGLIWMAFRWIPRAYGYVFYVYNDKQIWKQAIYSSLFGTRRHDQFGGIIGRYSVPALTSQ